MTLSKKYLWIPIDTGAPKCRLTLTQHGEVLFSVEVSLARNLFCDYYAPLSVESFAGAKLAVDNSVKQAEQVGFVQSDHLPQNDEPARPKLCYTAPTGWLNDPNGMVYENGVYHLYYQHNPVGAEWGNMSWGHAQSCDLVHWETLNEALYPDASGTIFSGCGMVDQKNTLGFGEDALAFFYTAAGAHSFQDEEQPFVQKLAVSTDHGKTLVRQGTILPHIAGDNRDPVVFWHQPSQSYCMILYLVEHDFGIFRSNDLRYWEQSQQLTLPDFFECPALFSIQDEHNEEQWVLWEAGGRYLVGRFDGYTFTATQEAKRLYATTLPYAAQLFSNTGDRRLMIAWLRTKHRAGCYTGALSFAMEVTLDGAHTLHLSPAKELESMRREVRTLKNLPILPPLSMNGEASELVCHFGKRQNGFAALILGDQLLTVDFAEQTISFGEGKERFSTDKPLSLRILIDVDIIAVFQEDVPCFFVENKERDLQKSVQGRFSFDCPEIQLITLKA